MAEIPIERKEGRNWLPLIGGLLALLVLGFCFLRPGNDDTATATNDTSGVGTAVGTAAAGAAGATDSAAAAAAASAAAPAGGARAASDAFTTYVAQRDTANESEGRHQYTAEGVRRLAAALEEISGGNPSIAVWADSMRSAVGRLQRSSDKDVHADDARAAFNAAVSAMAAIDKARGQTRDVEPMRKIAAELSSTRPLVPQLPVVHRFFEAARDAVHAMK